MSDGITRQELSSELNEELNVINNHINNTNNPHNVTPEKIGAVPSNRTINGKALSSNISLTSSDMDAVPTSRTINGKSLASNISLTATDVGAVPTNRTINGKSLSSNINLNEVDIGAVNVLAKYTGGGSNAIDPNTTQDPYILTNHSNSPDSSIYWHIHTYFYSSRTGNRAQQAISYSGSEPKMFIRHNYGGSWTPWKEVTGGGGGSMPVLVASNTLQESFDTVRTHTETPWNYLIGKHIPKGTGEIRITIDTYKNSTSGNLAVRLVPDMTTGFHLMNHVQIGGTITFPSYNLDWRTPLNTTFTSDLIFDLPILTKDVERRSTYQTIEAVVSVTAGIPLYILVGSASKSTQISWSCRNLRFYYDIIK